MPEYDFAVNQWELSKAAIIEHYNIETTAKARHNSIERLLNSKPTLV
jgi:hypothetical protein